MRLDQYSLSFSDKKGKVLLGMGEPEPLYRFCFLTTGARLFPPLGGLTFSSWFLVSRFGLAYDTHPIRFLSVVRHMSRTEQEFVCFSVSFSPQNRSLIISTEETAFQPLGKVFLSHSVVPTGSQSFGEKSRGSKD